MKIQSSFPVTSTFALDSVALRGGCATSIPDIQSACEDARREGLEFVALGSGSNIVPKPVVHAFVCEIHTRGVQRIRETKDRVWLEAAAGENWHEFVMSTLNHSLFGLENLALIPGAVGAAPIQNIGAYGVELDEFISSVKVMASDGHCTELSRDQCEFAYRTSVFKRTSDLTVVSVTFALLKHPRPVLSYPDVATRLRHLKQPTPKQIAKAVIDIRTEKLPNVKTHPNVGSFFKNPTVSVRQAEKLAEQIGQLNCYPQSNGVKLSAAQLIDLRGWKNRTSGPVAVWDKQPLVLVNKGATKSGPVLAFAHEIRDDIVSTWGIHLEIEPTLLS